MSRDPVPHRSTVSLAIEAPGDPGRLLVVLRPPDDPDLPGVWGLPAGRRAEGEAVDTAARRIGREKLGVEVEPLGVLEEGAIDRPAYRLGMVLLRARITAGEPSVPQPTEGVTRYAEWRWGRPADLEPAASMGSLCCRLLIRAREGRGG